jgi:uncharacterized membrane protein YfcA
MGGIIFMINAIRIALGLFTAWFGFFFIKDFSTAKSNNNLEQDTNFAASAAIGFTTNFFDTLGIGSFAPTTMLLRSFKQIHDRVLPGTLNVSCTIPVVAEAFIFISVIEVEPITLVSLLASAAVGAVLGAGIVSKWDEKKVQLVMGIALLATAFLMLSGQLGWTASLGTGTAIGLTGIKLVIAVVINFILGALMTAGIGLYAPCMAMIYMMGLSPKVAFPIMMGSCAFLMPPASVRFIKEGAYNKKASMAITIGGLVGVFIAAYIVKSLPIKILTYLVIVVVTYTAFTLLRDSRKAAKQAE